MKNSGFLRRFYSDDSGAVTVDWVVLSAAVVGLGVLVITTIAGSVDTMADNITTAVDHTHFGDITTP